MYIVTKTYPHSLGISACFRQWRAESHCRFLHGYALEFEFEFGAETLDDRNWVFDFGGLKELKQQLAHMYDHRTLVAWDDPEKDFLQEMHAKGIIDMLVVPATGCEMFAKDAYFLARNIVDEAPRKGHIVKTLSCTVREHGGNSASYRVAV